MRERESGGEKTKDARFQSFPTVVLPELVRLKEPPFFEVHADIPACILRPELVEDDALFGEQFFGWWRVAVVFILDPVPEQISDEDVVRSPPSVVWSLERYGRIEVECYEAF